MATGYLHSLALAWGRNTYGQLGLGDTGSHDTPTLVALNFVAVAAGIVHSLGLHADGSLYAWGHNDSGQLGLSDTTDRHTPTRVGTDKDWVAVAAGMHSLALKADGTLWAWGDNGFGKLGLGDNSDRPSPTKVPRFTAPRGRGDSP